MSAWSGWRRCLVAFGLAAIVLSNIAVFAPFALYAGNKEEFSVSLSEILLLYLGPALLVAALLGGIGSVLKRRAFVTYVLCLSAFACLTWLQGSILVWDYGELDGRSIPWLDTAWRGAIDSALWIAVLVAAIWFGEHVGKALVAGAVATFFIQLSVSGVGFLRGDIAPPEHQQAVYDPLQHQAMFRFSREKNVLHIVMDGFQSDVFAEIVRDPNNREIAEALSGFTFFTDNMGVYPYTQMTMPLLVSGNIYRNHKPVEEFLDETMKGPTILSVAESNGYEVDIASQAALVSVYARSSHTNIFNVPLGQHLSARDYAVSDAVRMMDLSLFRVAPHFVKAYIYQDDIWFLKRFAYDSAYLNIRYFSELEFLKQVRDELVVDRPTPVYKLFHLMLSHRPFVGNERCEYDEVGRPARLAVTLQARCGLLSIVEVLKRMKELGIYNNTVIVLMADHGAWLPASGYDQSSSTGDAPTPITAGMAIPTLAIKPFEANGSVETSNAPTTIADVPPTIATLIGVESGMLGTSAFDIAEGSERRRPFYTYAYGKNAKAPDYLHTMLEYEVTGSPFDAPSWRPIRRHAPGGVIENLEVTNR